MTLHEYRAEHPDLDHVPDEDVEKLLDFQAWRLNKAMDELGRAALKGMREIPLIGRIFRDW